MTGAYALHWSGDIARGGVVQTIEEIIREAKVVAVVGLSPREDRPSHGVARYLKEHGYRIIPVNPQVPEVLGERSYPDLRSIPEPVDVVDIFRRSAEVGPIVDDAVTIGAKAVWMQEGVINEEAAAIARRAGMGVVMDRCMLKEHRRLVAEDAP
ncbi:MAG: CoA-binding protein [Chloroflexi bacterium]|nr:CoA-binding protein [Chloroflexota bacterium]